MARNQGLKSFVGQSLSFARERFLGKVRYEFAYPRFSRLASHVENLDQAIEFAFSFRFLGVTIRPYQDVDEITSFFKVVQKENPGTVVEIGAGGGGTLFLFTRVARPDALLVSVDLPHSFAGKGYPPWKEPLFRSFASKRQRIELVRGDSHMESTAIEIKSRLGDRSIDVLFIDGDHSYEGVKRDFETYSALVRKGGIVAFHDIDQDHINPEVQVPRFWREVRTSHRNIEVSRGTRQNGIGILFIE